MLQNAFSQEDILLLSFKTLKIYLRALTRRLNVPRLYLRLFQVGFYLKDGIIAINQTRSQEDEVIRNKIYYYTCIRLATKY